MRFTAWSGSGACSRANRILVPLVLALSGPAFAQEDSAPVIETIPVGGEGAEPVAAADDGPTELDAVVVTAQRRLESLQATPISIEVFNADRLEQRGIEGLHDLSTQAPGLTIEPFPTHNATLRIFIRGVGIFDAQLTQDPAVGVYLDGVYIARSVGLALDIADLERIELLRGPQGTLYGRNTTGGAINLLTRRPQLGQFALGQVYSLSDRGGALSKTSLSVPVGEMLAVKGAYLRSGRNGYVVNTGPGGNFGDRGETALRLDARLVPVHWLTADYGYEKTDMSYYNYMFQPVLRPSTNKGQGELFKEYAETQSVYSASSRVALASGPPFEVSGTRINGHTLTLTAPLAAAGFDALELKYVGALRDLRDAEYADLGGGAGSLEYRLDSHAYDGPAADLANGGPTPLVIPTVTQEQQSHELQVVGDALGGALRFVAGVFYFNETATEDRHRLNHQVSTVVPPDQLDEVSQSFPEFDTVLDQLGIVDLGQIDNLRLVNFVDFNWDIENTATAWFGQATWTPPVLDERLHLTLGYRHSEDEREAVKFRISDTYVEITTDEGEQAAPLQSGEFFNNVPASKRFRDDSWTAVAAYDLTDSVHTYFKYAEAYKSGGFNVRDPHISGDSPNNAYGFGFVEGFAPEYVQSLELGVKSEWMRRRLRLNADVFDSDYTDMQINFLIPGTISDTKTMNAGEARMRGFELDSTFLAWPDLTLSADYAYLDARVLDVRDIDGNNVAHLFPFNSAPRHSYALAADWVFWRTGRADLRAYLGYNYVDRRNGIVITEERRGLTSIPAYGLFQLRLSVSNFTLDRWGAIDVALWGKNLLDKDYPVIAIDNVPHADRAVVWGEPRSVGLDLIYRYL